MVKLSGKNLGERQRDLNMQVKKAVSDYVDFEIIKGIHEQSDVDKLFKIDVASRYKNIEYLIEVLKSGDPLHILRVLKCDWMFDDTFSYIFNVDYLRHNVFPFMSIKMKKKLLITIANHVRDVDRVMNFCNYCMDNKLTSIAQKFVYFASDSYKIDYLRKNKNIMDEFSYKNNFKNFFGSSFAVADAYLSNLENETWKLAALRDMTFLYSVSDVQYLDMLEKHVSSCKYKLQTQFSLRISKDIITKHKSRVLKNPLLYINILNESAIKKYSSLENAKIFSIALLPEDVDDFWNHDFCKMYEHILDVLPADDKFAFIKKIFNEKYPKKPFEMSLEFYSHEYFRFMTTEQKEKMALDQIASQNEILGTGNDYKWYAFVSFETAFDAVKKLVKMTNDSNKRKEIINILIESAKTQRDLEKLFKYYYERHNNETQRIRENFMDQVATKHNVFEFDKDCWEAFNKIYQNLDVYHTVYIYNGKDEFKNIAFIYHVINKMDVHEALKLYITDSMSFYTLKFNTDKLPKEKQDMLYEYLYKFYTDKVIELDSVPYGDEVNKKLRRPITRILDLLRMYNKTKKDIPEVVVKLMKLDWDHYRYLMSEFETSKEIDQLDLIRFLKKDAKLVIEHLPSVKKIIEDNWKLNLDWFLRKIKVYFSNDVTEEYLKFYKELLTISKVGVRQAPSACFGIFRLADNNFKIDFMTKYAPTQSKVDRSEIDENLLNIQEAICATAFYSRPPVPLENILMYLKGDYVHCCLPMFNYYLANLPPQLCNEFITAILNKPLSIQKHGVRLAFATYDTDNLIKMILDSWNKNKNISLRRVLYKELYNKISTEKDQNIQTVLFETLKRITLELHQDDDNEVFELLTSGDLPKHFISDYIDAAWTAVNALSNSKSNNERKAKILDYMRVNIESIRQEVIRDIVEQFVKNEINAKDIMKASREPNSLNSNKQELAAVYLTIIQNKEDYETKWELTKLILTYCFGRTDLVAADKYILQQFCIDFITKLAYLSFGKKLETYEYIDKLFGATLQALNVSSSIEEIYMITWYLQINIIARQTLAEINTKLSSLSDETEKLATVKSSLLNFGQNIGNLIKGYMEKETYFNSFQCNIENGVTANTKNIVEYIVNLNTEHDDLLVLTSLGLMEFKIREIYLFALKILPSSYMGQYVEDYKTVINKLRDISNLEIKCVMYKKFGHCNFEPWVKED